MFILVCSLVLLIGYLFVMDIIQEKIHAPTAVEVDNTAELEKLREDVAYYKEREKRFLDKNSELYHKVTSLEQALENTKPSNTDSQSKPTVRNEKNPLISTTQSEYFNSILTDRYKDKP